MSRLASFRGPSTPSSSPVAHKQPNTPRSPSQTSESTFHRKTRTLLKEIRQIAETWDDLVLLDGLKAAKSLVDTRTDLDNALVLVPYKQPKARIVGPKLEVMDKRIAELDAVIVKLQKHFRRLNAVVENFEALLSESHKMKGWQWTHEEPLWVTWSLEKFVISIAEILLPYHRALYGHTALVKLLRSHSVSFEESRSAIAQWAEQPWLEDSGWDAKWEDICAVEVERWDIQK